MYVLPLEFLDVSCCPLKLKSRASLIRSQGFRWHFITQLRKKTLGSSTPYQPAPLSHVTGFPAGEPPSALHYLLFGLFSSVRPFNQFFFKLIKQYDLLRFRPILTCTLFNQLNIQNISANFFPP